MLAHKMYYNIYMKYTSLCTNITVSNQQMVGLILNYEIFDIVANKLIFYNNKGLCLIKGARKNEYVFDNDL